MSKKIDVVREALQTLVGKNIQSVAASDTSDDVDDRYFATIEIVATDGTVVRLKTGDGDSYSSWLEVSDESKDAKR